MSPWLFNIFIDGCMRELRAKVGNVGARLKVNGGSWPVAACLFADDTVLLAESESELQRVVNEFYNVCEEEAERTCREELGDGV